jgi:hypothetical protein
MLWGHAAEQRRVATTTRYRRERTAADDLLALILAILPVRDHARRSYRPGTTPAPMKEPRHGRHRHRPDPTIRPHRATRPDRRPRPPLAHRCRHRRDHREHGRRGPLPDRLQGWLAAFGVLTAAVIYLTWGTARGELTDRRWLTAQTAAVLAFGAVAITAAAVMVVTPDAARYLLAAAWLAHAGWDAVHHRAGRVVPRWYAEACLACDVLLATALLLVGAL